MIPAHHDRFAAVVVAAATLLWLALWIAGLFVTVASVALGR